MFFSFTAPSLFLAGLVIYFWEANRLQLSTSNLSRPSLYAKNTLKFARTYRSKYAFNRFFHS